MAARSREMHPVTLATSVKTCYDPLICCLLCWCFASHKVGAIKEAMAEGLGGIVYMSPEVFFKSLSVAQKIGPDQLAE